MKEMLVELMMFCIMICNGVLIVDILQPFPIPVALRMTVLFVCGIIPLAVGMIVGFRAIQTGANLFIDPVQKNGVILENKRRGRRAVFMRATMLDLELIRTKKKIFKDTGGGHIIAGHDVRQTHETVGHDLPENISQYLYKIKNKYMVSNLPALKKLAEKLKGLKESPVMSIERQLQAIPELNVAMNDPELKKELLAMDIKKLQKMEECIFDGEIVHYEVFEDFSDSVSPNELESFMNQHVSHRIAQAKAYNPKDMTDWARLAIPMMIIMIGGALAYIMISSA